MGRQEERGVERQNISRSSLKGREVAIVSQANIETTSEGNAGGTSEVTPGAERIWAVPSS